MNIPEFATVHEKFKRLVPTDKQAVEDLWQAGFALWEYSLEKAYKPIRAKLIESGVETPEKLELIGDYKLFWWGNRLRELGREIAEGDLSFRWSRYEFERGRIGWSLDLLWGFRNAEMVIERWEQLRMAFKDRGYNMSAIIDPLLNDAEFKRLAEGLDGANGKFGIQAVTAADAAFAVELMQELRAILAGVFR